MGAPVVGGEENEGIFGDAIVGVAIPIGILESGAYAAEVLVDTGDQAGVFCF